MLWCGRETPELGGYAMKPGLTPSVNRAARADSRTAVREGWEGFAAVALNQSRGSRRPPSGRVKRSIRVVIADDEALVLEGLRALLGRRGFAVVGLARDGDEAVSVAQETRPDVVVLDVVMPKRNGLDVARALLTASPPSALVLMTGRADHGFVLEGITLGVHGFVEKTAAAAELVEAIRAAARGVTYVSPAYGAVMRGVLPTTRAVGQRALSPREREVLSLIADGKTTREIAAALGITRKTAETHRARVMQKLDLHDIAALVRYAIREQIAEA
jgi:DNA-binding NarL/FixJ family response regulator